MYTGSDPCDWMFTEDYLCRVSRDVDRPFLIRHDGKSLYRNHGYSQVFLTDITVLNLVISPKLIATRFTSSLYQTYDLLEIRLTKKMLYWNDNILLGACSCLPPNKAWRHVVTLQLQIRVVINYLPMRWKSHVRSFQPLFADRAFCAFYKCQKVCLKHIQMRITKGYET